jgi:hypothetical protein
MLPFARSISDLQLSRRNRLIVYYLTGLALLVLVYTVVYNLAMARLEGVNQSIFASFEFVVQTMTTTGYGQDSGIWSHPLMYLFVALTQISGIGIGFFTLRLIIVPLFTGAEVNLDNRLTPIGTTSLSVSTAVTRPFSSTSSENSTSSTSSFRPTKTTPENSPTRDIPSSMARHRTRRRSSEPASIPHGRLLPTPGTRTSTRF